MRYLIRGILLALVLIAALKADAQEHVCRDKELEVACRTALEASEELLRQKDTKTLYLENMLEMQLSQQEMQSKLLLDYVNPPWYSDYRYTFLIGIITGLTITKGVSR